MASRASKRTNAAAKRAAGEGSRPVPGDAFDDFDQAAELSAQQSRDRVPHEAIRRTTSTGAGAPMGQRVTTAPTNSDGLRGAKPNPLPPGMDIGARLASQQSRDRFEQDGGANEDETEEPPLLQLGTRSYTQPDETSEEKERTRQQQMSRTMRQFIGPSPTEERAPSERAPSRSVQARPGRAQEEGENVPGSVTLQEEADTAALLAQQQQLQRQAEAQQQAEEAQQQEAADREGAALQLQRAKRLWQIVEGVEGISLVGILLLIAQLNIQVINHFFFKNTRIPSASFPEMVTCFCIDCIVCGLVIMLLLAVIAVPYLLSNLSIWDLLNLKLGG